MTLKQAVLSAVVPAFFIRAISVCDAFLVMLFFESNLPTIPFSRDLPRCRATNFRLADNTLGAHVVASSSNSARADPLANTIVIEPAKLSCWE
jgi:hypothetical protein